MSVVKPFNIPSIEPVSLQAISSAVGTIVDITEQGIARVDFPENPGAPVIAKSTLTEADKFEFTGSPVEVLLVFEHSDPAKPVITGLINKTLFTPVPQEAKDASKQDDQQLDFSHNGKQTDATIDGKKITFNAKEEILLRCGKSSILLRRDGKIVIKGANLVSRSSASNKIKGSSVSIN